MVPPKAETITASCSPFFRRGAMIDSISLMRCGEPTEVPPNLRTFMGFKLKKPTFWESDALFRSFLQQTTRLRGGSRNDSRLCCDLILHWLLFS